MGKSTFKLLVLILVFGVQIQSVLAQENFKKSLKMEGRVMFDFNFLSTSGYEKDDILIAPLDFSGNEFRRVRLAAKGKIAKNVDFKAEFDFAGGKVGFRDVYIKYGMPSGLGSFKLGSFTEPSSLNNMTSSKYITFFERSMLSNTQPYKYNAGIMYENYTLLEGKLGLQMAYTFGGNTNTNAAFKDDHLKEGANFIGRITGIAFQNKEAKQILHLGANFENRVTDNGEYSYAYRIENHMGDKKTIGVDELEKLNNAQDIGFELATTFGSLSLQAEYELATINLKIGDDVTDEDKKYYSRTSSGYYAFVSYFLTGEHRPYKKSSFGRVKPNKEFCIKERGFGAVELVARYSAMDYRNYAIYSELENNKNMAISNISLGFNWYLNNNARIIYNYTNGDFNDFNTYGPEVNLTGHLIRFQVDF